MFDWLKRKRQKPALPKPDRESPPSLEQGIRDVSDCIARQVAGGFADCNAIVDYALEAYCDEYDVEKLRPHAEKALDAAIGKQLEAEQHWPDVTDCDRLDQAFAWLEKQGVVCRQNFSCCGTCAAAEIDDEIADERDKGREVIGCAHYHEQDTEHAVEGYGVYLSYGSVLEGEKPTLDIGHLIIQAMRDQGLETHWDGTCAKRIKVELDWKRRLNRRH